MVYKLCACVYAACIRGGCTLSPENLFSLCSLCSLSLSLSLSRSHSLQDLAAVHKCSLFLPTFPFDISSCSSSLAGRFSSLKYWHFFYCCCTVTALLLGVQPEEQKGVGQRKQLAAEDEQRDACIDRVRRDARSGHESDTQPLIRLLFIFILVSLFTSSHSSSGDVVSCRECCPTAFPLSNQSNGI